jgi:uncharacterized protein (UPF0305 family)
MVKDLIAHNIEEMEIIKENILNDVKKAEELLNEIKKLAEFIEVLDEQIKVNRSNDVMDFTLLCECGEVIYPYEVYVRGESLYCGYRNKCIKCHKELKHENS